MIECINQPVPLSKHVKSCHRRILALTSEPKKWWSVSGYFLKRSIYYVRKLGNPVIVLKQTRSFSSGCMLCYICKKNSFVKGSFPWTGILQLRMLWCWSGYNNVTSCRLIVDHLFS